MKAELFDISFFEEWLREKRRLSESSIFVYVRSVERFLAKDPDIHNLDDYNNFLIEVAIKKRCNHYYSALKAYIEFKITDGNIKNRIISGLIKPKERKDLARERKHLNEDKILEIINYLENDKNKIIALIQSITGVRAGDILRLKRGGIVPEEYQGKPVLRLNIIGKGGKRNPVFIHDEVIQGLIMDYILNNHNHDEYYFIELGRYKNRPGSVGHEHLLVRMNYNWYWADLKQALQTAGVSKDDFATHDYRRCFARRVWEKWKDVHKLQKALNHADPKVTMRYLEQSGLQNIDIHYEMQNS